MGRELLLSWLFLPMFNESSCSHLWEWLLFFPPFVYVTKLTVYLVETLAAMAASPDGRPSGSTPFPLCPRFRKQCSRCRLRRPGTCWICGRHRWCGFELLLLYLVFCWLPLLKQKLKGFNLLPICFNLSYLFKGQSLNIFIAGFTEYSIFIAIMTMLANVLFLFFR